MKNLFITVVLFLISSMSIACPTCEKAQPKIFRGITHGAGPDSNWDYLIIGCTAIIVLYCGYITVSRLIKPNEMNKEHIKNAFLN
ncbi:hypothetical protein [Flavobacterium polysaccharolyticum]|uniref:CcmD family protein n=1 Tax=Flavobacterium polysaccharolyticum TaxID=3133148 RepID=A0ABU9NJD4_9FLAO|nr:hypothetical protein [uncultured Flavobacterium sp.]